MISDVEKSTRVVLGAREAMDRTYAKPSISVPSLGSHSFRRHTSFASGWDAWLATWDYVWFSCSCMGRIV
jgi:hypothetical protein